MFASFSVSKDVYVTAVVVSSFFGSDVEQEKSTIATNVVRAVFFIGIRFKMIMKLQKAIQTARKIALHVLCVLSCSHACFECDR